MPTVLRKDGFAVRIYFNDRLLRFMFSKVEDRQELTSIVELKVLNWLRLKE
ncbi:hypothetical protein [Microseira wollei]|uniref:hypothetical protein n=1 Tax=Microseira wollei TaxID=467598 RepID=UPI001CFC8593|nr:hypothetical protein [Microseira wollei]